MELIAFQIINVSVNLSVLSALVVKIIHTETASINIQI